MKASKRCISKSAFLQAASNFQVPEISSKKDNI